MLVEYIKSLPVTFLNVILNLIYKSIVANRVEKDDLAIYFTIIDIFSFILFLVVGFRSSMIVSYQQLKDDKDILNILRFSLIFLALLSWSIVIPYIKHYLNINIEYEYLVLLIIVMSLSVYFNNELAMYKLFNAINSVVFLEPIFFIIWFLIVLSIFDINYFNVLIISTILSFLSLSIFAYIKKRHFKEPPFQKILFSNEIKQFVKNTFFSTLEFIFGIVTIYLAVIFYINDFSLEELADFQVVIKLVLFFYLTIFIFPMFRYVLPELTKLTIDKNIDKILSIRRNFFIFGVISWSLLLIIIYIFGENIIINLFGEKYINSIEKIQLLSVFLIFLFLNNFQILILKSSNQFLKSLIVRLIGLTIFMTTYFILKQINLNDINIILSLGVGYISMFICSFIFERKILKQLKQ
ncbi:MAG: hypothetical protein HXX81_02870 [Campylobacterales bacterium]|nr:hypothetical protein [Campylobacterales bacterium]